MSIKLTKSLLAQQIRICREDNLSYEQSADNIMHFFDVRRAPFGRIRPTIGSITAVRSRNNNLWMKLLEIALEAAPDETKEVLRQINANDREISGLLGELAK